MRHNIKLPDGSIQSIDCKFGSGWKDKYGREIFLRSPSSSLEF